jgi:uncharacterized protein YceH (UPF0502 family)
MNTAPESVMALQLSPTEARVLASLAEKSLTTPQYYPMTVNAIMLASNQKSSRNPVMALNEGDVGAALARLEQEKLVSRDDSLGRVPKWRHQFHHQLLLQPQPFALLLALILRGPQTLSELRANASALGGPADADATSAAIKDLAERAEPLAVLLPRAPGQKEQRYATTLTPAPSPSAAMAAPAPMPASPQPAPAPAAPEPGALAALEERIKQLEARVEALEQKVPSAQVT